MDDAGPTQAKQSPGDRRVLDYFHAPPRDRWRLWRRVMRWMVAATTLVLVHVMFGTMKWLGNVGPVLPAIAVIKPVGIHDGIVTLRMGDKLSSAAHYFGAERIETIAELFKYCGLTAMRGETASPATDEQQLLDELVAQDSHWDEGRKVWTCRLPYGRLDVGEKSATYWPDNNRWYVENRNGPDATNASHSGEFSSPGVELHYLQLPQGFQSVRFSPGGSWHASYLDIPQWQSPAWLTRALWCGMIFSAIVILLAVLAAREGSSARSANRAAWIATIWAVLMLTLWYVSMRSILPMSHMVPLPTPVRAPARFEALLAPAIAGGLLALLLWAHVLLLKTAKQPAEASASEVTES